MDKVDKQIAKELSRISPEELAELGRVDFGKYFNGLTEPAKKKFEEVAADLEQRAQAEAIERGYITAAELKTLTDDQIAEKVQAGLMHDKAAAEAQEKAGALRLEAKHIVQTNAAVVLEGRSKEEARLLFDLVQEETAKKQQKQAIAEANRSAPMVLLDETAEFTDHAERMAATALSHPIMAGGALMALKGGGGGDLFGKGLKVALIALATYFMAPELFEKMTTALGIRDYFNKPPTTPVWVGKSRQKKAIESVPAGADELDTAADGLGTDTPTVAAENKPSTEGEPEMSLDQGKTEAGAAVHLTAEEAEAVARGAVGDVALQAAKAGARGVSPEMADKVTRQDGKDFDAVLAGFIGSVKKTNNLNF